MWHILKVWRVWFVVGLAFLTLITLPLHFKLSVPVGNIAVKEFNEAGHTLLFFMLQLGIIWAFLTWSGKQTVPAKALVILATITTLIGGAIEFIQPLFQREASVVDFLRNLLGISAASFTYWAWKGRPLHKPKLWPLICAFAFIFAGLFQALYWLRAQYIRDHQFPVIANFESVGMGKLWHTHRRAEMRVGVPGALWPDNPSNALLVQTEANSPWGGAVIEYVSPYWFDYDYLSMEIFSENAEFHRLEISLLPAASNHPPIKYHITAGPGENIIKLPINKDQNLNHQLISSVHWYSREKFAVRFWLDNIQLLKSTDP